MYKLYTYNRSSLHISIANTIQIATLPLITATVYKTLDLMCRVVH